MPKDMTKDEIDGLVLYFLNRPDVNEAQRMDRWLLVERVFGVRVPEPLRNDDHPQDREIREAVSRLRIKGHLICDMGDGGGRWIARTEDEFWKFYHYYVKPIQARAQTAEAMRKAAAQKWPNLLQPSLFNMLEEA